MFDLVSAAVDCADSHADGVGSKTRVIGGVNAFVLARAGQSTGAAGPVVDVRRIAAEIFEMTLVGRVLP